MEYWDFHAFTEFFLNIKTLWRFDIFQIDTAKGGFQRRNNIDQFIWIEFIHLNIENINTWEFLKQNAFTFHHGFTGQCADITQPQHGGTVRDNGH